MDTADKILAKRYALAYIGDIGINAGAKASSAISSRIAELAQLYENLKPYTSALKHPIISASVKMEILGQIANKKTAAWNFICLLVQSSRFYLLDEILSCCNSQSDKIQGIIRADLLSPYPLPQAMVERIKKIISPDASKVIIRQIEDKAAIGGFELRTGDFVLDATLRGKLKAMQREFSI